jgi:DNA mismatch repair protein MutL
MPIRVLSANLIDQIAAGEVIERPASVVKELVENAFDAGARRIDIDIERAGLGLIRVRDDGCGIEPDELPLAVLRHATSKIATLDDLTGIASLGFRGEALPSIGSVARLRLVSRRQGGAQGYELTVEGGERSALKPAAHPVGTTVEVRDLFYNVPARRKFVRSEPTEFGHILRQIERLALSVPAVGFHLRHNGRELLDLPPAADRGALERRLDRILGAEFRSRALPLDAQSGPIGLSGWLGLPTAARAQADQQFWFVNTRAVRDRVLANAVRLGYRDVLYHGRHPSYLLYLTVDPRAVDVNAHPSKLELRFRDSRAVHDAVFRQVERALAATKPAPRSETIAPPAGAVPDAADGMSGGAGRGAGIDAGAQYSVALTTPVSFPAPAPAPAPATATAAALRAGLSALQGLSADAAGQADAAAQEHPLGIALAQLHGLYILAQNREGLIVVDAHAAHERVLYEQLKREYDAAAPAAQLLLEPLRVHAAEHEIDALLAQQAELTRLGFELERYAPEALAVRRVPVLLAQLDLAALLTELAGELTAEAGSHHLDGAAHRMLGSIACRAAIRGQRALSAAQMDALLRQMEHTDRASQCNHGRPTWLRLTLREIDQLFLRGR